MKTNILYLHGLNGKLSEEKEGILKEYGNVFAPHIDYVNDDFFPMLLDLIMNKKIDTVIGSSMGGYVGYSLALILDMPCMLFNPALAKYSIPQDIQPPEDCRKKSLTYIALGKKDTVIPFFDNLDHISNINYDGNIHVSIKPEMEHRIPVDEFAVEASRFFVLNRLVNLTDDLSVTEIVHE